MSQSILIVRNFAFPDGSQVSVPLRLCDSMDEARLAATTIASDIAKLMETQLTVLHKGGEAEVVGLTAAQFLGQLGVVKLSHGFVPVEKNSAVLAPAQPNLIVVS